MLRSLLAVVVPPSCLACRAPTPVGRRLCTSCRRALADGPARRCPRCALALPCAPCPARGAAFERAWAAADYDGPARALVLALKRDGRRAAADAIAAQIATGAPPELLRGALVPVPSDPWRRRARGFDHADLLARALARRTGGPLARCLERERGSPHQVGVGRATRLRAGRIVVTLRRAPPLHAILVDDVHTTGATLEACARALRDGGSASVAALTFARTAR